MRRRSPSFVICHLSFVISILLTACGSTTPAATQLPAAGPPAVTITGPTATQPPPAVTFGGPTVDATAPAATAQPAPTAEAVIGPETYPAGINPLTGLPVDEATLNHRILAIKVANFPYYVRPQAPVSNNIPFPCQQGSGADLKNICAQSGLSQADSVFEHYAEGGTTRFTAVFYGQAADRVGPIRSARLIDTVIPEMFKSALVATGSSNGVLRRLGGKDWFDLVIAETTGYGCPLLCLVNLFPEDPTAIPDANSIFTSTTAVRAVLVAKGLDTRQPFRGVAYSTELPAGGVPLTHLRIEYSGAAHAEWAYDSTTQRYWRSQDKNATEMQPHLDAANGQQLSAANVIVLFVNHVVDFNVPEDFDADGFTGHFSTEAQLWATGPAWLLRDGQVDQLTWVRLNAGDMLGLVEANNRVVPLKPGNTWYQIVGLTSETLTEGVAWLVRHRSPTDKGEIPGRPSPTPTVAGAAPTEMATPTP